MEQRLWRDRRTDEVWIVTVTFSTPATIRFRQQAAGRVLGAGYRTVFPQGWEVADITDDQLGELLEKAK